MSSGLSRRKFHSFPCRSRTGNVAGQHGGFSTLAAALRALAAALRAALGVFSPGAIGMTVVMSAFPVLEEVSGEGGCS